MAIATLLVMIGFPFPLAEYSERLRKSNIKDSSGFLSTFFTFVSNGEKLSNSGKNQGIDEGLSCVERVRCQVCVDERENRRMGKGQGAYHIVLWLIRGRRL